MNILVAGCGKVGSRLAYALSERGFDVCIVEQDAELFDNLPSDFVGYTIHGVPIDQDVLKKADPMTYAYYHKVVKGKSPKNAPTYIAEEEVKAAKWVCGICGYEYDGTVPFEELSDDFVCPICKQPKTVFKSL